MRAGPARAATATLGVIPSPFILEFPRGFSVDHRNSSIGLDRYGPIVDRVPISFDTATVEMLQLCRKTLEPGVQLGPRRCQIDQDATDGGMVNDSRSRVGTGNGAKVAPVPRPRALSLVNRDWIHPGPPRPLRHRRAIGQLASL